MIKTSGSKLVDLLEARGASRIELAYSRVLDDHGVAAFFDEITPVSSLAFELRKKGFHAVDLSKEARPRVEVFALEEGSASDLQREVARAVYVALQRKGVNPAKVAWKHAGHDPTVKGSWAAREWAKMGRKRK